MIEKVTSFKQKIFMWFVFCTIVLLNTQAQSFIHPGGWHTASDIQRIRAKISANAEPWLSAKNALMVYPQTETYVPSAVPVVKRDKVDNTGRNNFQKDADAAYTLMVKWIATNNIAYADAAIRVIDAWSATLQELSGSDIRLLVGPVGGKLAQAAELAAYAKPDWPDKVRAQNMFETLFYPVVHVGASANWGTACMEGIMSFAVFCEDTAMFNEAIYAYKNGFSVPDGVAGVIDYINDFGETAESGRDQAHPQGGVMHLLSVAVTAYNQGINIFDYPGDHRLKLGFEYLAKYNLGYDVPYAPFTSGRAINWYPNGISSVARGQFSKVWEIAFNYFRITGQASPYSQMVAMHYAPEGTEIEAPGFGTLTFRQDTLWGSTAQTITFPNITLKSYNAPDFDPGATSSSGLPIVYSSSNTTVATITADGKVHMIGGGTSTIYAYQLGDRTYSPAIASRVLTATREGFKRIEAEEYNIQSGIQTEATQDVDGNLNLSFVDPGDWTSYSSLDFGTKGATKFYIRYACLATTKVEIRLGSATGILVGTCDLPATGAYQNWKTDSCKITGLTGVKDVYLVYIARANINWFRIDSTTINGQGQTITFPNIPQKNVASADFNPGATASSNLLVIYTSSNSSVAVVNNNKIHITGIGTTYITASQTGDIKYASALPVRDTLVVISSTVSAPYKPNVVPGVIEAEEYDYGGEGIAYHDTRGNNLSGYRNGDLVETETKTISSNSWNLAYGGGTEWLKYTLNATDSGQYQVSLNYAHNGALTDIFKFTVQIDGGIAKEYSVNATGSWTTYQTYKFPLTLSAGTQVMKITMGGASGDGNVNLDVFTFIRDISVYSPSLKNNNNEYSYIYPNPANDYITINLPFIPENDLKMDFKSMNGKVLLEGMLYKNSNNIDIHTLPSGMYFVTLKNSKVKITLKLLKL